MSDKEEPKFHRDKEGKIKKIIDTFLVMLNKMEYSEISTNKIAKEAEVSIGTLYNYFRNKEEILQFIFSNISEDIIELEDVMKIIVERDLHATKKFIANYLKNHQDYYSLNKAHDQAMIINQNIFLAFQETIRAYVSSYLKIARENKFDFGSATDEVLTKVFLIVLNIIDTQVHHHLFRKQVFDSDTDLINYLAELFQFTLNLYLS